MKKSIMAIVSLVLAGTMAFGLAACDQTGTPGGEENKHSHVWSKDGTDNGDGTHKLTCSGNGECDEGGTKNEAHDTKGADGACSVCGYKDNGKDDGKDDGKTVVNKELLEAIDATLAAENYKLTMEMGADITFLFNGEILTADTVIMSTPVEVTGGMILQGIPGNADGKNPVHFSDGGITYEIDLANYIFSETSSYSDGDETEYYKVDGTSISRYYQKRNYYWDDSTQEESYTSAPAKQSYTGYANSDATKALFKKFLASELEGASIETVVNAEVKGIGEHSDRTGTLRELEDLFEYDEATKTYSATVDASLAGGEGYSECTVDITVEDGKVAAVSMIVPGGDMFDDILDDLPDGLTVEANMVVSCNYSNIGTTIVTVPEEYDDIDPENISETPVLSASALEELLADYSTNEFVLNFDWESKFMDVTSGEYQTREEYYAYYVDIQSKSIMLECQWYGEDSGESRYYYNVIDGQVSSWSWLSYLGQYGDPYSTDITGDEIDALIKGASSYTYGFYLTDYCAGFDEGELKDLVDKFEYTKFNEITANLTLNGKDVEVVVRFDYYFNGEEYEYDCYVNVYYLDNEDYYFGIRPKAKADLEYWHPDNFKEDEGDGDNN